MMEISSPELVTNILGKYRHWRYKNTALLLVSLGIFFYFIDSPAIRNAIVSLHELGYFGAFIAGIFFTSTFTIAPAMVLLYNFADTLNPWIVAVIAGGGGMFGDYLLFRFLRNRLFDELGPIFNYIGGSKVKKIFHTPYFAWMLPLFGALIIASPFPDEPGIGLLGISKIKPWQFLVVAFLLDTIGVLLIVLSARYL